MKTKTKLTIAVASVLSVATLAGTGYAGWVLSHSVEGNANGNMTAYGVADKTVKLSPIGFKDNKNSIVWGKTNKADGVKGTWFGYTSGEVDGVADEFFTPVLEFTITNNGDEGDISTPVFEKATITVTDTQTKDYATCLKDGLIDGPEVGVATNIKEPTGINNQNVFSYEMSLLDTKGKPFFGWGTKFGGQNPINYYNKQSAEAFVSGTEGNKWFDDAKETMEKIEKLKDVQFRIDLKVNHASL